MISFRFHVVSITAIFLAIAIGVVVGSTYVDELTVDQLRNRIETVEDRADATRSENGRLEDELSTSRDYIDLSAEYAVTDRLTEVPVLFAAARGIDEAAVERAVLLARRAGVAKGTVFRHFASKDDLIASLVCERLTTLTDALRRLADARDPGDAEAITMLGRSLKKPPQRGTAQSPEPPARIKETFEESAWLQLKAVLEPKR